MPIKGVSDQRRLPRLGKIHTGIKKEKKNDQGVVIATYPSAVDYFVCPPEVQALFGEKPKELVVMFPIEDETKFASQYYKNYSSFRGLVCKGDGEACVRLIDAKTGDFAHRDTLTTDMKEMPCNGRDCVMYQQKKCREVMCLQFLLPAVPGLGIWQLDTGSYHSIIAVNSAVDLIRSICGRISMIPLKLVLEPREVAPDGKKKKVNILQIRADVTLAEIQKLAALPASRCLLPAPEEEKPELLYPDAEEGTAVEPDVVAPATESDILFEPPKPTGGINMEWLTEQIGILQGHKLKAWTNKAILERLNATLKGNYATPAEALSHLTPEQAEQFANSVKEAAEMCG